MQRFARPLQRLIDAFERLPGIGPKSAQRLALHLLRTTSDVSSELANAILDARSNVRQCEVCFNLSDAPRCPICSDPVRDHHVITVVADVRDLMALDNAGDYRGTYHVLDGLISPMDGIGPEKLHVRELLQRLEDEQVQEVILATNPTVEGDATALYLARLLKPLGVRVTRIALGLPVGGDLDYADQMTIMRALEGRTEM
ncbi:MAG TPA: recombination mediator RecR [Armatimonadota bacterium]|nr:recombination mediator RecR [Armatimonadota bacterium]